MVKRERLGHGMKRIWGALHGCITWLEEAIALRGAAWEGPILMCWKDFSSMLRIWRFLNQHRLTTCITATGGSKALQNTRYFAVEYLS